MYMYMSVQIRAGPAEERGRVCRCNEAQRRGSILEFKDKWIFSELEVAPFGAFLVQNLDFGTTFLQIAWNTKKLFRFKVALL